MVNFVLNNLCGEALKGFHSRLQLLCLPAVTASRWCAFCRFHKMPLPYIKWVIRGSRNETQKLEALSFLYFAYRSGWHRCRAADSRGNTHGYKDSDLLGFGRLFFTTASLKSLTMRQHSLVFCLALVKNRQTKTARHLSRRKFCANLLDIDVAWLTPSKEKSSKLAKNNKRETEMFESLYPSSTPG